MRARAFGFRESDSRRCEHACAFAGPFAHQSCSLRNGVLASESALAGIAAPALAHSDDNEGLRCGVVFTSSNDQSGNELLVYARCRNGTLTLHSHAAMGGQGTGAGLGSQGAVTLSGDGRYVFGVNARMTARSLS